MSTSDYHFITRWRVKSTRQELYEIFSNGPDLARWWPSVYLEVRELAPGDASGLGKMLDLYTKGWLPYTLRWQFVVTHIGQDRLELAAQGDFVGRGIWTFAQDGEWASITYDWKVRAEKPLLRWLSALIKPIFAANHLWAMSMGQRSLDLELARRRAAPEQRASIPPPPGPTTTSPLPLLLGLLAVSAGLAWAVYVATRQRFPHPLRA